MFLTLQEVLYRRVVVPARLSRDGETPTIVYATRETNGYAVWLEDPDGSKMLQYFYEREKALEHAVFTAEAYGENQP